METMQESIMFSSPPKRTRTARITDLPMPMISIPVPRRGRLRDTDSSLSENIDKIMAVPELQQPFCAEPGPPMENVPISTPYISHDETEMRVDVELSTIDEPMDTELSSIEMEGKFVDTAINNVRTLPQVVSEVALMQKDQADELQRQKLILDGLKANLAHENDNQNEIKKEIAEAVRQSYLTQSDATKMEGDCQQIEKDLEKLSIQIARGRNKIEEAEEKLGREIALYEEYSAKMKKYTAEVSAAEVTKTIYQQVSEQLEKVTTLLAEKDDVESNPTEAKNIIDGVHEIQLEKEIESAAMEQQRLDLVIKEKSEELKNEKIESDKVQKDIEVLHKRNAAQLTRLKRQYREVQARHGHWYEQAAQLERSIAETRAKLDSDS